MSSDDNGDSSASRPSGLAGVFRNLTSRPRLQSTSNSDSTGEMAASYGSLPRTLSRTGLADLLGRSPTPEAIPSVMDIFDVQALVDDVSPEQPLAHRITSAEASLRTVQGLLPEQAMEYWTSARGLLLIHDSLEAQIVGAKALESLCSRTDLDDAARKTLLNDIRSPCLPDVTPYLLRALVKMTHQTQHIGFTSSPFIPTVIPWLDDLYNAVASTKAVLRRDKTSQATTKLLAERQADLTVALQYLAAIIASGHEKRVPAFSVHTLVRNIASICKKTTTEIDIKNSLKVFDAVLRHMTVSNADLLIIIELVCGTYASVGRLLITVSETVTALLKSDKVEILVAILLRFLTEPPHDYSRHLNVVRGAVLVFKDAISQDATAIMSCVTFEETMDALATARLNDLPKLDGDILSLCYSLLGGGTREKTLEKDWTKFLDIINKCSDRAIEIFDATTSSTQNVRAHAKDHGEHIESIVQHATGILDRFAALWPDLRLEQRRLVAAYFIKAHCMIQSEQARQVADYYKSERLCFCTTDNWNSNSSLMLNKFFKDHRQSYVTRLRALATLEAAYLENEDSLRAFQSHGLLHALVDAVSTEHDFEAMKALVSSLVTIASKVESEFACTIVKALNDYILKSHQGDGSPPRAPSPSEGVPLKAPTKTLGGLAANALVRILVRSISSVPLVAIASFSSLLAIVKSIGTPQDARLHALRALFNIRCDAAGGIYLLPCAEIESVESALLRTSDIPLASTSTDQGRAPLTRVTLRATSAPSLPKRLPAWTLMDENLSEMPNEAGSQVILAYFNSKGDEASGDRAVLKLNIWLELVISLLQRELDWEVYSYVIVHLGMQLTNNELFRNAKAQVKLLRSVLCEQVKHQTFHDPPHATGMKKAEVAACIFEILTKLLAFKGEFAQSEEDELVRTFLLGIGSWDGTTRPCIHALSMCNLEIPLSVTKSLTALLVKMAQIITMPQVAVHILEFLAGLSRLPDVFVNLRDEEIRTVFGICIRYLQTAREHRYFNKESGSQSSSRSANTSSWPPGGIRNVSSPVSSESEPSQADGLSQYVYILTYQIMISWFLSLKLRDRANHVNWITRRLCFTDENGREVVEESSQVLIDMMQRTAFSDLGETVCHPDFAKPEDGAVISKSWVIGMSIVTIETATATGLTQITKRMSSGTTHSTWQQHSAQLPSHHMPLRTSEPASVSDGPSVSNAVFPSHVLLQLTSSAMPMPRNAQPVVLPEDEATNRALRVFDRFDTVDGHKAGIVYIREGQTHEKEILANTSGSPHYEKFLAGLGTKVPTKDAGFNLQGLVPEVDGEFTYAWRDRVSEIVYHVTTMMPTNLEHDPQCINKKRHIGNDFVNVIYNDSNKGFKFDTIPSQFNAINIVVEPTGRAVKDSEVNPIDGTPFEKTYFKITVLSKPDYPSISPAAEPKVVSGEHLAACIRLFVINASVFTLVWSNRENGEYISSWRHRLRAIKTLHDRVKGAGDVKSGPDIVEGEYMGYRSSRAKSMYPDEANTARAAAATRTSALAKRDNDSSHEREDSIVDALDFSSWTL